MDEEGERAALRKEKRLTETGICPFRVSGSASASFLPGLTLFDGKRPSLFEERRGEEGWVGRMDTYECSIGQKSNSPSFSSVRVSIERIFLPWSDDTPDPGGKEEGRGHAREAIRGRINRCMSSSNIVTVGLH